MVADIEKLPHCLNSLLQSATVGVNKNLNVRLRSIAHFEKIVNSLTTKKHPAARGIFISSY